MRLLPKEPFQVAKAISGSLGNDSCNKQKDNDSRTIIAVVPVFVGVQL